MAYGTVNVGEKVTLSDLGGVPSSRKVNNKPLSSDITLAAGDVGAVPTTRKVNNKALSADISLSAADVGAVPTGRTVNGKALSANISLSAGDVGAAASSHNHSAANITSGTLAVARGGTGATSLSSITVGAANKCNGLTFAIAATNPGAAANNKVYFVY